MDGHTTDTISQSITTTGVEAPRPEVAGGEVVEVAEDDGLGSVGDPSDPGRMGVGATSAADMATSRRIARLTDPPVLQRNRVAIIAALQGVVNTLQGYVTMLQGQNAQQHVNTLQQHIATLTHLIGNLNIDPDANT
ncbi:hypothetical protein LTR27_002292 [Elasticomyces elasticus]|nr:hypothetical protein LTR27_002292 [Elasticomyces elasticus]